MSQTHRLRSLLLLAALLGFVPSTCQSVDVWVTTGNKSELLSQRHDVVFQDGFGSSGTAIIIDPDQTFQSMEGYGAAMTNSSASLLQGNLTAAQRDRLMTDLFSAEDGIGLNYLRVVMGASDFTADGFYTYNDLGPGQTDPNQTLFSIDPDRATILPSLDQARAVNPDLKLMASPWSAPGWMKTSGSVIGGELAPQWHASYATYLRKFVEAYAAEGHPIDTITLQNEPLFTPNNYPGMGMSAAQQIDLIKNHVGPTLQAAGLETGILAYDHNWDDTDYPIAVLNDPDARQFVEGTAFHGYAGNVSAQTTVRNAHPDKTIHFTEISGGDFAPNFEDNLIWYSRNLTIGGARNWGSSVLMWNLALDQNGDPHLGGCSDCRGVVTIDSNSGAVTHNEEFYALGHASRFLQPGAVRIGSTSIGNLIETAAFQNPDGSEVLLALNPSNSDQAFRGIRDGEHFNYTLPARGIATFVWDADDRADFNNGGFEKGGFDPTGGSLDGWNVFGNDAQNVTVTNSIALDEDNSLSLTGNGQFNSFSGITQGITVAGGETVELQASFFIPSQGGISGTNNSVALQVEFYDLFGGQLFSGDFISKEEVLLATGSTTTDQWLTESINEIVPSGAVEARLVVVFSQPTGQAGSVFVDDLIFNVSVPLLGDFNNDGIVDAADYTVWRDNLGAAESTGVLNGNGDGGVVDVNDYQLWVANYGSVISSLSQTSASVTTIPEPSSYVLLVLGICFLCSSSVGAKFIP